MKSKDGLFVKKYHWEDLAIGESVFEQGNGNSIRSTACMWGTRYGVWLGVNKTDGGFLVTRYAEPRFPKRRVRPVAVKTLEEQLKQHHDALRALTLLVLGIKKTLEEKL